MKDFKNEETLHEIMRYSAVIRKIYDASEQLHYMWQGESGDRIHSRVIALTEEMNNDCEDLRKWIISG